MVRLGYWFAFPAWAVVFLAAPAVLVAQEPSARPAAKSTFASLSAERGYRFLTEKAYLPADFDEATFDEVWKVWPAELKERAEKASPEERRKLAFARYGLTPRPEDPAKPLQYVVANGVWTMNCFACHGGTVRGETYPGAPNSRYALQTLTDDTRAVKLLAGRKLGRMDVGSVFVPLGTSNGVTNAVMFGVALMNFRDADLNLVVDRPPPAMTHHDMDAPPWWHFHRKSQLYIDGFAGKGHRGLMQFMLVRQNGPEKFHEWEGDYRDVFAYLESLRPPKYPHPIDKPLAERGRMAFNRTCADCHGTYGDGSAFPGKIVPIDEVATDRVRLDSLTTEHRAGYGKSWFAEHGKLKNVDSPVGYVAPPLDGVWASGPYFHNGSVPTLWHVLHPSERPKIWRRTGDEDRERVGVAFEAVSSAPRFGAVRREYYHTGDFGKSAAGHEFPNQLSEEEKQAVLEYLKTL